MPLAPAPDPVDRALAPLLSEPFASAWATPLAAPALRERLLARSALSRAAEAPMHTVRQRRAARVRVAEGVDLQTLYEAPADRALRAGEPRRTGLFALAAGARLGAAAQATGAGEREWLVLSGRVRWGADALSVRDYHRVPAGGATPAWLAEAPTLLFLRESDLPAAAGDAPLTVRDADAGWPAYAPGIRRRVLWSRDGQAAMLYHADPGAQVPQHRHGHDEECLMVQGELFLDDLLLQTGDYQLAPAGSGHRVTQTDTGVVLYAHGDLDLQFVDGT